MGTMKNAHDVRLGRLEVRHLRLVQAVAAEANVTRAAGRLHLSQSAVSHQLLDLERDLGARLFDRVGKKMVPTAAGARLVDAASRLLAELSGIERDVLGMREGARVPLRVASSCYTSYHWLPTALTRFGREHPRVDIAVVLDATRRVEEALANDEVDLAIVNEAPRDEAWAKLPIVTSEFVALVSPKHPAVADQRKKTPSLRWSDLRGRTILVPDISDKLLARLESAVRESWHAESGERLATPFDLRKVPITEALVELARGGHGIAVMDRWTVEPYVRKDLLAVPILPRGKRTFHAVWRKANPRGLPIEELVAIIEGTATVRVERGSAASPGKSRP